MTLQEIEKKLAENTAERKKLMSALARANEEESRSRELFSKTKKAILKLWDIYFKDEDNAEALKRLNEVDNQPRLDMWLEADVSGCLRISKLEDIQLIRGIVDGLNIDFDKCVEDAAIRLDFASAFKAVKKGTDLSHKLSWSFNTEDLLNLMELHKKNKFRRKIEDLLEDCNFHSECGMLNEKRYDEFEKYVNESN